MREREREKEKEICERMIDSGILRKRVAYVTVHTLKKIAIELRKILGGERKTSRLSTI